MSAPAPALPDPPALQPNQATERPGASWWRDPYRLVVAVLAVASALGAVILSRNVFPVLSLDNDEPIYKLQAQVISHGHLFPGAPPPASAYLPWLAVIDHGHYVLKYTPLIPSWFALSLAVSGGFLVAKALTAAGVVIMTYLLARDVLDDRRAGVLAAAIVAISPLVLIQSALLLPYLPTLFLVELFAWLLVRGVRGSQESRGSGARWFVGAGLTLGCLLTIRPFDAVLLAGPMVIAVAISSPLRHRRLSATGWTVLGLLPPLIGLLVFNHAATGELLKGPFNLLESQDKLGFGIRLLYPGDTRHHFQLTDGLASIARHLWLLAIWIAGGGILLVLAVIAAFRRRLPAAAAVLACSAAALAVGYIFFWGAWNAADLWGGVSLVGPFYLMFLIVPVAICGSRGLLDLYDSRRWAGALAGAVCVGLAVVVLVIAVAGNLGYTRRDQQVGALVSSTGRSVVFVATTPSFLGHPNSLLSNPPLSRTDRSSDPKQLLALTLGRSDFAVLDSHPDRPAWLLKITEHGGRNPHTNESTTLSKLRELTGPQVGLTLALPARAFTSPPPGSPGGIVGPGAQPLGSDPGQLFQGAEYHAPTITITTAGTTSTYKVPYAMNHRGLELPLVVTPAGVQVAALTPTSTAAAPESVGKGAIVITVNSADHLPSDKKSGRVWRLQVPTITEAGAVRLLLADAPVATTGPPLEPAPVLTKSQGFWVR
jgi:hypothetical protein